ncbi:aspartate--tRNA ligase [Empedobacter sp.]|uniref:aspartate--tRNA ligase n=1 Tax=Empedobacter sp. TaxID=1927715 RepID=UPI0028A9C4AF|nr:aspartate--tRNA ligase [Empedobacter sp.]
MFRTHTCGELTQANINEKVTLSGWVSTLRDKGFMMWIDLRDRYGITQIILDEERSSKELFETARHLGREFVIQVTGTVIERASKNPNIPTGDIEILAENITILNESALPPFTIEDNTDGGEDIRMKYRYLDIRRNPVKEKLIFRSKVAQEVRKYLDAQFKQLLMVGGLDRYFQIVKCFRDEDLRADRQPEFTQIDCEMSFVEQEDIMNVFEGLAKHLLHTFKGLEFEQFPRMTFAEAMRRYGNDKPDIRFGMEFGEITDLAKGKDFKIFDEQELIVGIAAEGCNAYTRKDIDKLIEWVQRPQIGATGLVWARYNEDGTFKSSVDKFYSQEDLAAWAERMNAKPGDLMLVMSGNTNKVRAQLSALRMEIAERLGLRNPEVFAPLWVVDFPLLEWDEESERYHAMHHPFTSPKPEDMELIATNPGEVRANAYDLVLNGNEIGGGSIRIFDKEVQARMFELLGFTPDQAEAQFGFLMNAFKYGAPPHGGLAFGFDRFVSILDGSETIRDYIAFPKNNSGRDVMIDAPSPIDQTQMDELNIASTFVAK